MKGLFSPIHKPSPKNNESTGKEVNKCQDTIKFQLGLSVFGESQRRKFAFCTFSNCLMSECFLPLLENPDEYGHFASGQRNSSSSA